MQIVGLIIYISRSIARYNNENCSVHQSTIPLKTTSQKKPTKLAYNYREPRLSSRGAGAPDNDLQNSHQSRRKGTQNLRNVGLISDRPWYRGPSSMLLNGRRGSVLGEERPSREVNRSQPSCAEVNPLIPNDPNRGRTAPLTSKVAFYILI